MKKIIILLATIVSCGSLFSQRVIDRSEDYTIQTGDYITDKNIDKYTGIWEWRSGNELFRIELVKKTKLKLEFGNLCVYMDEAIGWHSYMKNGVTIEESFSRKDNNLPLNNLMDYLKRSSLSGTVGKQDYMSILIKTGDCKWSQNVRLQFLPGETGEIRWRIYNKECLTPAKQANFIIPVDIVLKKVK